MKVFEFCSRSPARGTRLTAGVVLLQREASPEGPCATAKRYASLSVGSAAASGKIALIELPAARIHVFQNLPTGLVRRCFCGNATIAALQIAGLDRAVVVGPQHRHLVAERRGRRLGLVVPGEPEPPLLLPWGDRPVFVLSNFNRYAAVVGGPNDLPPQANGLNAKALAVDATGTIPIVRVRVAAGWHGAVPMTAGAELVLAAPEMGLADRFKDTPFIRFASGEVDELPTYCGFADCFALTFAERFIDFTPVMNMAHAS